MDRFADALSSDSDESGGGASPLPQLSPQFADEWAYQFFMVLPMNALKPYNQDTVNRIVCRIILERVGEYDGSIFPPILESWQNPTSICYKITCTRKKFESIRAEAVSVYTDFGGSAETMMCYQTSEAML